VAQRLGGSLGLSLLTTFLAVLEQARVAAALHGMGARGGQLVHALGGHAIAGVAAPIRAQVLQAAITGFHDTIWLLVGLAALGLVAAVALHDSGRRATRA
jgi:predicted PurR-regulated permease PerM